VPGQSLGDRRCPVHSNIFPKPDQAPNLRWIQLYSAGINHAVKERLSADNVDVTTASGIHATPMSEFSLAIDAGFTYKLPKILNFRRRRSGWRMATAYSRRFRCVTYPRPLSAMAYRA